MAPNNELSSIMFERRDLEINADMCRGTSAPSSPSSGRHNKESDCVAGPGEESQSRSPVSITNTNLLDVQYTHVGDTIAIPPPPRHPASHDYSEGKVSVTRSARKRRIKRGCLASPSSEEVSFHMSYRIYRPDLLQSTSGIPMLVLHGGP